MLFEWIGYVAAPALMTGGSLLYWQMKAAKERKAARIEVGLHEAGRMIVHASHFFGYTPRDVVEMHIEVAKLVDGPTKEATLRIHAMFLCYHFVWLTEMTKEMDTLERMKLHNRTASNGWFNEHRIQSLLDDIGYSDSPKRLAMKYYNVLEEVHKTGVALTFMENQTDEVLAWHVKRFGNEELFKPSYGPRTEIDEHKSAVFREDNQAKHDAKERHWLKEEARRIMAQHDKWNEQRIEYDTLLSYADGLVAQRETEISLEQFEQALPYQQVVLFMRGMRYVELSGHADLQRSFVESLAGKMYRDVVYLAHYAAFASTHLEETDMALIQKWSGERLTFEAYMDKLGYELEVMPLALEAPKEPVEEVEEVVESYQKQADLLSEEYDTLIARVEEGKEQEMDGVAMRIDWLSDEYKRLTRELQVERARMNEFIEADILRQEVKRITETLEAPQIISPSAHMNLIQATNELLKETNPLKRMKNESTYVRLQETLQHEDNTRRNKNTSEWRTRQSVGRQEGDGTVYVFISDRRTVNHTEFRAFFNLLAWRMDTTPMQALRHFVQAEERGELFDYIHEACCTMAHEMYDLMLRRAFTLTADGTLYAGRHGIGVDEMLQLMRKYHQNQIRCFPQKGPDPLFDAEPDAELGSRHMLLFDWKIFGVSGTLGNIESFLNRPEWSVLGLAWLVSKAVRSGQSATLGGLLFRNDYAWTGLRNAAQTYAYDLAVDHMSTLGEQLAHLAAANLIFADQRLELLKYITDNPSDGKYAAHADNLQHMIVNELLQVDVDHELPRHAVTTPQLVQFTLKQYAKVYNHNVDRLAPMLLDIVHLAGMRHH